MFGLGPGPAIVAARLGRHGFGDHSALGCKVRVRRGQSGGGIGCGLGEEGGPGGHLAFRLRVVPPC